MPSKTISFRIPAESNDEVNRLAHRFGVDRTTILSRFILEGLEGVKRYEDAGLPMDWPRPGRMRMEIAKPDASCNNEDRKQIIRKECRQK